MRESTFSSVDFPAPLRPTIPTTCPGSMLKLRKCPLHPLRVKSALLPERRQEAAKKYCLPELSQGGTAC